MMKKFINLTMIVLVMSSIVLANDGENYSKDHWKIFTKNLVVGLKSDNHGVQQASMVLILRYKDKLDLNKTVFPLIDIYRKDPNERMRQLATVALFYTQNKWAENYLRENFNNFCKDLINRKFDTLIWDLYYYYSKMARSTFHYGSNDK